MWWVHIPVGDRDRGFDSKTVYSISTVSEDKTAGKKKTFSATSNEDAATGLAGEIQSWTILGTKIFNNVYEKD